ncbi:MAG: DMT family transporter [Oculatellaceae cyanobacterium Prado106]|jgi:drug/metabolite transporter (DMT)-like permease|nr:DMT family transporter [Oculatellaceae cyanobacterium Prado106]
MHRFVGIILVALSAAAFGTLAIFSRYAYADGMDALTILFLRFSLAALLMLALLVARGELLPRGSVLLKLVGMGAIGYVGQAFAYLTALQYASAGLVALLLYLYPIFVALIAALVLHEPITRPKGLALGLALLGTVLTVGPLGGQAIGALLAVAGAVIYSIYIIVGTDVMKHASAVQSSAVIFTAAGICAGVLMLLNGPRFPATGQGWVAILSMVVIATLIPVATFLAGLERIGPTNAAMLSTLEPVVTVLLAYGWLNEALTPIALLGGGLILIAVLLLTHSELRRS